MNRVLAATAAIAMLLAVPAVTLAHTGSITVAQDCQSWSASVSLANNVAAGRTVVVTSTIPGTTGLTGHYDTTTATGDTQIWNASGPAVASGTVTLTISEGTTVEFSASADLPQPNSCPTPSPSTSATPTASPSPTSSLVPPTSKTTLPPTNGLPSGNPGGGALALALMSILAAGVVVLLWDRRVRV